MIPVAILGFIATIALQNVEFIRAHIFNIILIIYGLPVLNFIYVFGYLKGTIERIVQTTLAEEYEKYFR